MVIMIVTTLTAKRPAERKASGVYRVVWREDNEERWTGWRNCLWDISADLVKLWWAVTGAVVQRHAVIATSWMSFQW